MSGMERKYAGEAAAFIKSFPSSFTRKNPDAIRCTRCNAVVLQTTDKDIPDRLFSIYGKMGFMEAKAAPVNGSQNGSTYSFDQLTEGQNAFMSRTFLDMNVFSWLWIHFGQERAGTLATNRRRVFLVPWSIYKLTEENLMNPLEEGKKVYPGNRTLHLTAETVTSVAHKRRVMNAERLWGAYELEWRDGQWVAGPGHVFNAVYLNNIPDFSDAIAARL